MFYVNVNNVKISGETGLKGDTGEPGIPAKLSSLLDSEMDPVESK